MKINSDTLPYTKTINNIKHQKAVIHCLRLAALKKQLKTGAALDEHLLDSGSFRRVGLAKSAAAVPKSKCIQQPHDQRSKGPADFACYTGRGDFASSWVQGEAVQTWQPWHTPFWMYAVALLILALFFPCLNAVLTTVLDSGWYWCPGRNWLFMLCPQNTFHIEAILEYQERTWEDHQTCRPVAWIEPEAQTALYIAEKMVPGVGIKASCSIAALHW